LHTETHHHDHHLLVKIMDPNVCSSCLVADVPHADCAQESEPENQETLAGGVFNLKPLTEELPSIVFLELGLSWPPSERCCFAVRDERIVRQDVALVQDIVGSNGARMLNKSEPFGESRLSQDFLTCFLPKTVFVFDDPGTLREFIVQYKDIARDFTTPMDLNIEIDFFTAMDSDKRARYAAWEEPKQYVPHGRDVNAVKFFEVWFNAIKELPEEATVYLVFRHFWRDFRQLRGLASKSGLSQRQVMFLFPDPAPYARLDDHEFFIELTVASVTGIVVAPMYGINQARRTMLVNHGCAGFNPPRNMA
tara:strand:- start:32352 stop:33272 length:921 start_codon:yes stop_codon:yes gene_type:complete